MLFLNRHRRCARLEWRGVVFTLHPAECTGVGASMVSTSCDVPLEMMGEFRRDHAHLPFFSGARGPFGAAQFLPDVPAIGARILPI